MLTSPSADLSLCSQEPIKIPGSVQPNGLLLALEDTSLRVLQVSANAEDYFNVNPLGQLLSDLVGREWTEQFRTTITHTSLEGTPLYLGTLTLEASQRADAFQAITHRNNGFLILELEMVDSLQPVNFADLYSSVRTFMSELQRVKKAQDLTMLAAREVRRITGFDRVLIYKFSDVWDGQVVAEDRDQAVPSYQGLWFPASDIPKQALELYRLNRLRLISDVGYEPVPIVPPLHPDTSQPIDLSFSVLRSVSPIHIEYLKNMGVGASMSISILRNGELWGLIACHHRVARPISFQIRTACDFLGQAFALQLAAAEQTADYAQRFKLKLIESQLLTYMAQEEHFVDGLIKHPADVLRLMQAEGVAIIFQDQCTLLGSTPTEDLVRQIPDWLTTQQHNDVYHSHEFGTDIQDGRFVEKASGVLAIAISKLSPSYVIWFRPEVVQTVKWAGSPVKAVQPETDGERFRIHPRKSFETWRETVRGKALAWDKAEIDAAADLRVSILEIVLRKAEELALLTGELERSNKELEAFSYSVSHDLRAPFRHIVGYSSLLRERVSSGGDEDTIRYVDTIIESARSAGSLVDNLLHFAQIGRASLTLGLISQSALVAEVSGELQREIPPTREVVWRIAGNLPAVQGDLVLLRLVWQNLISNALKYSRTRECSEVEVSFQEMDTETIFFVRDNGVGFDSRYAHKLFGVFQRLHRMEDFEGNGIGLANVRRIVSRHGGRTWAEGAVGKGATFFFSLPKEIANR